MDVKKNDDSMEKLYKELAELGADAEAFRMADPTIEEITTLVSELKRAKICTEIQEDLPLRRNRETFMP